MDLLLVIVIGVIAVAVVTALAERLGVAGPLLLVALGLAIGLLPFVEVPEIDPELILVGVLPPLLYASAVRLPAIEFRRDLAPISGLAVVLVIITALVLGWFFSLVLPGVGFALGVALGAIISPTDAVATSIAKRLGISPRVTTMLEGESLLNDATALVLLRTALIAAVAGTFSFGSAVGAFVWAGFIAIVIGALVGFLTLRLRAWVRSSAASTAIGFTVPFLAYLPTEHLNGSGLVAAVIAGIVSGQGAARWFTPEQRLSDQVNWRTVELVLEGGIFLIMGLELDQIVSGVAGRHEGLGLATTVALCALVIVLVVRAVYVSLLLWAGRNRASRMDRSQFERVARALADFDYYQSSPLGWKHGTVIVWAGMRGVVTLAAAQTIPRSVEDRPVLIYIAFVVALVSLMLQGFTLPWLSNRLKLDAPGEGADDAAEQERLAGELREAAASALSAADLRRRDGSPFEPELIERMGLRYAAPATQETTAFEQDMLELRLALNVAMRGRLTTLSSGGAFSTRTLRRTLAELDADQLSLELRLSGNE